jgi:anaerobic selenocysteine-containing dehydrogenase
VFDSAISQKADVFLAAAGILERDGSYAVIEGILARLCDADGPIGGARPDWEALTGLANMMGATNFNYESVEDVFNEMMTVIAPGFQGSFQSLILPGPRNDLTVRDPGGARKRTPEYNPGDYRVDGAHFRWTGPAVDMSAEFPAVASAPEGQLLLTWGEHVQGDDYHLNHASIAHLLKAAPYAEINPVDAKKFGITDVHRRYKAHMTFQGSTYALELAVRRGPAPGTLYMPARLGDIRLEGLGAAQPVELRIVGQVELAGVS